MKIFYGKILGVLVATFFITQFLSRTLFLNASPRINPQFIAQLPSNVGSFLAAPFEALQSTELTGNGSIMQSGAILFSWYYCPPDGRTCIPDRWKYHPPGTSTPYPNGQYYRPGDSSWWDVEASDMTCSGLDIAFVYMWESPYIGNVSKFVTSIQKINSPLKIAEYWDASYAGTGDLGNTENAVLHYQKFVKPFYEAVPKDMWATQNGRPILAVYRYGTDKFTGSEKSADFFKTIKTQFRNDFGVEPFLVLGHVWFWNQTAAPQLEEVADGKNEAFPSATCAGGNAKINTLNGYTTSTIAPGAWDDNNQGGCHLERNDDAVFKLGFSQVPDNNNLLMIESWNELGEGSGMERAIDYPKNGGGVLPETFYMDTLRGLLGKEARGACKSIAQIVGGNGSNPTVPPTQPSQNPNPTAPPNNPNPTVPPNNPQPTTPPQTTQVGTVKIVVHKDTADGPIWDEGNKVVQVYLEGPTARGRFGESLNVFGSDRTNCTSGGGFPYTCTVGTAEWKGADGVSGTSAGSYTVSIFNTPAGWEAAEEFSSSTGDLAVGQVLTLDLVVTKSQN